MGFTYVDAKISNPFLNGKSVTHNFLVDSGALYSLFPKEIVKKLKIKSRRKQKFTLANGKRIIREVGLATIRIKKREADVEVILGTGSELPLLGVMSLEALGFELDPIGRKLKQTQLILA